MSTIDLFPRQEKIISLEEYITLSSDQKANFARSVILPPSFDSDDFGSIHVKLMSPEYGATYGK